MIRYWHDYSVNLILLSPVLVKLHQLLSYCTHMDKAVFYVFPLGQISHYLNLSSRSLPVFDSHICCTIISQLAADDFIDVWRWDKFCCFVSGWLQTDHEKNCTSKPRICEKCGTQVLIMKYDNHLKNHCPKREVTCEFCSLSMPFSEKEVSQFGFCSSLAIFLSFLIIKEFIILHPYREREI